MLSDNHVFYSHNERWGLLETDLKQLIVWRLCVHAIQGGVTSQVQVYKEAAGGFTGQRWPWFGASWLPYLCSCFTCCWSRWHLRPITLVEVPPTTIKARTLTEPTQWVWFRVRNFSDMVQMHSLTWNFSLLYDLCNIVFVVVLWLHNSDYRKNVLTKAREVCEHTNMYLQNIKKAAFLYLQSQVQTFCFSTS